MAMDDDKMKRFWAIDDYDYRMFYLDNNKLYCSITKFAYLNSSKTCEILHEGIERMYILCKQEIDVYTDENEFNEALQWKLIK